MWLLVDTPVVVSPPNPPLPVLVVVPALLDTATCPPAPLLTPTPEPVLAVADEASLELLMVLLALAVLMVLLALAVLLALREPLPRVVAAPPESPPPVVSLSPIPLVAAP